MKAAAKMFGLKRDDLDETEWAALVNVVKVIHEKNGGKKRGKR